MNVFPFDHTYIVKSFYFTPQQIKTASAKIVFHPLFCIMVWFEVADTRPIAYLGPLLLPGTVGWTRLGQSKVSSFQ